MGAFKELLKHPNWVGALAAEGRVFYASDGAGADTVTGQTSHATTTPTFQLAVPQDTTAIPLLMSLCQTGTVAGGDILLVVEFDNALRYSSSGTAETMFCSRTDGKGAYAGTSPATFRSNPTATDAYGIRVFGLDLAPDVSPAEGAVQEVLWTPANGVPDFLVGPASWNVYTSAGSTAPTWLWSFKWACIPSAWLD